MSQFPHPSPEEAPAAGIPSARPQRSREMLIHEYIQQARARLEAAAASTPNLSGAFSSPVAASSTSPSTADPARTTSPTTTTDSTATTSPLTPGRSTTGSSTTGFPTTGPSKANSSIPRPAIPRPSPNPSYQNPTGQGYGRPGQSPSAPFPGRAPPPQAGWPLSPGRDDRIPPHQRIAHGAPRGGRLPVAAPRYQNYPLFGPQAIKRTGDHPARAHGVAPTQSHGYGRFDREGNPIPVRRGPPPRQAPQYPMRGGNSFAAARTHPTPSSIGPPNTYRPPPSANYSAPGVAAPRSPPAHVAPPPSIAVIPEEAENRKSRRSSDVSSNASGVLYEASEAGKAYSAINEFLAGYSDGESSEPAGDSYGSSHVKQASFGQMQRPVVTNVSTAPRRNDDGGATERTVPTVFVDLVSPADDIEAQSPSSAQGISRKAVPVPSQMPIEQTVPRPVSPESVGSLSPDLSQDATPPNSAPYPTHSRSPLMPAASRFSLSPVPFRPSSVNSEAQANPNQDSPRELGGDSRKQQTLEVPGMSEGDTRASMTSLKGLILRNLRLASNLERGVTSSKFGLDWIINAQAQESDEKPRSRDSRGSMLNLFPTTPTPRSPQADRGQVPLSAWAVAGEITDPPARSQANQQVTKRRKRCCGLPLWAFIVAVVVLVVLIAAAILIPVALIVIPDQKHPKSQRSPHGANELGVCNQSWQCANGGSLMSSSADGSCYCVCVNGWSGERCTMHKTADCVTTDLDRVSNATAGSAVPSVFESAGKEFNIDLDGILILSLFSNANASCALENELVSFHRVAARSAVPEMPSRASAEPTIIDAASADAALVTARPSHEILRQRAAKAAITNGIIYEPSSEASGAPRAPSTTSSAIPAYASPSVSPSTDGGTSGLGPTSARTLEFARLAVLYIFQSSTHLSVATEAHSKLQAFFDAPEDANSSSLNLGNGWRADLVNKHVWYSGR